MTRLLYISVCFRARQDTISYSFICIIQNSQFQDVRSENFRIQKVGIQKTGFQNRETGILKVGNWTGKLQDSENFRIGKLDRETSEFRKLQNSELDAIRYAIVFHWFWSVGLSPKTPQAD